MESRKNASEESASKLCEQAEKEQDFEKLLELASRLQRLIDAKSEKKSLER